MPFFKTHFKNNKRVFLIVSTILFLFVVAYVSTQTPAPATILVPVKRGGIREEISDYGKTYFEDILTLYAPQSGWISKVNANLGQRVKKYESPLFTISSGTAPLLDSRTRATLTSQWESSRSQVMQLRAQLQRLKIALSASQRELERKESVFAAGAISQQEIEAQRAKVKDLQQERRAMEASVDAAIHQRDAARAALSNESGHNTDSLTIYAQKEGILSWIYDEKPRFVNLGAPILDIASPGHLGFEIDLLAGEARKVRPGLLVSFTDFPARGSVQRVSPTALPKTSPLGVSEQRTRVWIAFDSNIEENVPAGLELEAHIELAHRENTLTIPKTAVWTEGTQSYIFKENNQKISKTVITIGLESLRNVEIRTGLAEGDWVVLLPNEEMQSGQKITPVREF